MIARCDTCNNITTITYQTKEYPGSIQETYFECIVCHTHYTCFVTDKTVRRLHKQAKKLRETKQINKLNDLQKEINKRMVRLKSELS